MPGQSNSVPPILSLRRFSAASRTDCDQWYNVAVAADVLVHRDGGFMEPDV
jgi:hypothetical protein